MILQIICGKLILDAANLRAALRNDGIVEEKKDRLVFLAGHEFSNPGPAAAVIHRGQANGLTSWKDSKETALKQKEERAIHQIPADHVLKDATEERQYVDVDCSR